VGWDIGFVIFALALIAVGWAIIRALAPAEQADLAAAR
jgi:hypothetical protein